MLRKMKATKKSPGIINAIVVMARFSDGSFRQVDLSEKEINMIFDFIKDTDGGIICFEEEIKGIRGERVFKDYENG